MASEAAALPPVCLIRGDVAVCPHEGCGALDRIGEEDSCTRVNPLEFSRDEDGELYAEATAIDPHFEVMRYLCRSCGRSVLLPEDVEVIWS